MSFNYSTALWPHSDDAFFRDLDISPKLQYGPHCVAACLSMLTGEPQRSYIDVVNTQDPLAWSDELKNHGKKLAYCPADVRRLEFYMPELVDYDDLFLLCYYTPTDPHRILEDPDEHGWVCGSHVVILHRDRIYDPAKGEAVKADIHRCTTKHTKRVFRIVPADHERGI